MGVVESIAFGVAILLILVGALGTVIPVLPGLPLIWLTMLGFGFVEGFTRVDGRFLTITLAVLIAAEVADHWGRAWGARRFGASKAGAVGAVVGSFAGLFFLPLGLFLGPFLGAVVAELISGRTTTESVRAGFGGLIGALGSMVVKVIIAIGMLIAFIVTVL